MFGFIIGILFLYFILYKKIFAKNFHERTGRKLSFWGIFNPNNWHYM